MERDLDRLTARTFDVLVVGGGIYGLTIAYDAAQRGLATALVERDDFGSGASFNHLRTIHGGLRYLQTLDLARARESVGERSTLARIAPHAVRPLPFALPLYRSLMRGKPVVRAGFLLDRLVAARRNHNVPAFLKLPAGRVVSRREAIERFPGLRRQGLTGAAVWYDYITPESDRLTFTWAIAAHEHGAVLANHVEAVEPILEGRRVSAVRVRDTITGGTFDVAAKATVNATGAAIDRLLSRVGVSPKQPMLRAMNVVTRRDAGDEALGGRLPEGRNLFLVPWRERALFGTWESGRAVPPDSQPDAVEERDVVSFVRDLNQAFPSLDLTLDDVTLVQSGIVPAVTHPDGRVTLQGREQIRDQAADGIEGLVTVAGTKYTTASAVAERVTDLLLRKLQQPFVPCRTATTTLPGGGIRDASVAIGEARREHDAGLPPETIPHLIAAYGSRFRDVLELSDQGPELRTRLSRTMPVIGVQLVWAARHEMAVTLADAVMRRTPLGALEEPDPAALDRAAAIVGSELGWSENRRRSEIDAVRRIYAGLRPARVTAP
jgi:glycerol-3-phosphate dehydrogenase